MTEEIRIRGLHYHQWMENTDAVPFGVEVLAYDGTGQSMQAGSFMLGLAAGAGSSTSTSPKTLAALMAEVHGGNEVSDSVALTRTANSVAAIVGRYSHVGTNASTYLGAAIRGEIGGLSTSAYAAILAVLGGDNGTTTATAAFAIDYENSTVASGFLYGLDLAGGGSHDGYRAVTFRDGGADIRLNSGGLIVSLTTAITANSTTTSYAAGTLGKTTNATGRASLFVSDGSKWQFLTNS